jgi:aspartate-semialdehyde dehydrogenase
MFCDFEDKPAARLRAPMLEDKKVAADADTIHCIVHPAAVTLARLLVLLHELSPVERCVATILEPVSEYGKEGIDELHKQAVSLFNFQPMPKEVFDTQVSFTMSPAYGEDSEHSLAASELRIEKHLATLLGPRRITIPSIRLVHAPVFHGHCQNVWIEFAKRPAVADIEKALAEAGADVRTGGTEPASNVGVAGHSGMIVSNISEDRGHGHGIWLWVASDNLRTRADNALLTAALLTRKKVK